ncbi:hypothetical protein [Halorubrum sp. BV1]|uniref:hypothetical protein n=1 Tax=Halorubrum sp. BV1 TaxID=1498500 RepID=UPI000678E0F4|nr:hypothetical protein [Halorubrum sp. BV1]
MISHTTPSTAAIRVICCLVLCFALVGASVGADTAVAQQETTIDVSVDGDRLVDGTEHVVLTDPTANVSVEANATIDLIEIRVDGDIRHTYRPDSRSFSRAIPLDLDPNENTVEVIARADDVATFEATMTKHTAAPRVRYTSPFSTSVLGGPDNETNVSSGQVQLAGSLHTVSSVSHIRIERTHVYSDGNETNLTNCDSQPECHTDRTLHRINDPGDSFSQDLLLGEGRNEIVARYTDENGRTNVDSFRLIVDDETDPEIDLDVPNESYVDSVRVRGTVRDETKLHRVTLNRTSNNASQVLLTGTDSEPDPNRFTHEFDTTVSLYDAENEFRLVAEDAAGNVHEQTFTVEYDPSPNISVTENETNTTAETVRVAGTVSEAQISRVTLETIDTRSGDRLDITRAYEANTPTTRVEFDQSLTAVPGHTVVNVIVSYGNRQVTKSVTPSVDRPADERVANETASDASTESAPENDTSGVVSAAETDGATDDETGDDDSPADGDAGGPTLVPLRTRDAFGGVVVVGATYLLGHWV